MLDNTKRKNEITTAHNRRLEKKRVQWLNQASCFEIRRLGQDRRTIVKAME
jgi:hypothetical protein